MKILHVTLGVPPNRTGGLVKYVLDLASTQVDMGESVFFLFPGSLNVIKKKMYVKSLKKEISGIKLYELVNSLPLAIFNGIKNPQDFMKPCDEEEFVRFLKSIKPDIIHVHSLMGIPKEFFLAAKRENIKIVFTSHDYFGLAPEPNFYYSGNDYSTENSVKNWVTASQFALSTKKLRLFQYKYYFIIKKMLKMVVKKENQISSKKDFNENEDIECSVFDEYVLLQKYYTEIFGLISFFHFNSKIAEQVYRNNLGEKIIKNFDTISISNLSISQSNVTICNERESGKIRIGYIGPYKEFKGYNFFKSLTQNMKSEKYEFHLFGDDYNDFDDIAINHGKYDSANLKEVYSQIDCLIVPSVWKETFGLTTLESLQNNRVVFVSENVGAKDILPGFFIFKDIQDLISKIDIYFKEDRYYKHQITLPTMMENYEKLRGIYREVYK